MLSWRMTVRAVVDLAHRQVSAHFWLVLAFFVVKLALRELAWVIIARNVFRRVPERTSLTTVLDEL